MSNIPTQLENPKGFHQRYIVDKINGKRDRNAEYFVLGLDTGWSDLKHIAACRIAINAYDLRDRYPLIP
jgi:hypothetical protein